MADDKPVQAVDVDNKAPTMVPPRWWLPGHDAATGEAVVCELVPGCELLVLHCHVGDQIYYSEEELLAVYPDGLVPNVLANAVEWIKNQFVTTLQVPPPFSESPPGPSTPFPRGTSQPSGAGRRSDHSSPTLSRWLPAPSSEPQDHMHVSFDGVPKAEITPGTFVTVTKEGTVSPARPGDAVTGIVTRVTYQKSGGGSVDIATDTEAWIRQHRINRVAQ